MLSDKDIENVKNAIESYPTVKRCNWLKSREWWVLKMAR